MIFASAKFVGAEADPIQIVFMRYAVAATIVSGIVWMIYRGFAPLRSPRPGMHAARTAAGVVAELCVISAPLFIAYADATAISLTDGVIAMILAILLLKERASPAHWLAAMTCLAGAMLIARADAGFASFGTHAVGLSVALFGAILSGVEMYFIKKLADLEKPLAIMLYVNILAALMLAGPAFWVWKPLSGGDLVWLLMIGPLALVAQFFWIKAMQGADAVVIIPIGYATIPFAALIGAVAFDQTLGLQELIGAALVVVGGVFLGRLASQREDLSGPASDPEFGERG